VGARRLQRVRDGRSLRREPNRVRRGVDRLRRDGAARRHGAGRAAGLVALAVREPHPQAQVRGVLRALLDAREIRGRARAGHAQRDAVHHDRADPVHLAGGLHGDRHRQE